MRLTFETLWPLILLIAICLLWFVQRSSAVDLSKRHRLIAGSGRSIIVLLLSLAMTQPVLWRKGQWVSLVYLVDLSQSIAPSGIRSSLEWVRRTNKAGVPSHSIFLPFAANTIALHSLEDLGRVPVSTDSVRGAIDRRATNIEDALLEGLRSFAPHHLKRLVLITDGNENRGRLLSVLPRLRENGVRVYTVPVQAREDGDAWVEGITSPRQVTAEQPFPVEVVIYSQSRTVAEVEISAEGRTLGSRRMVLSEGPNRVAFETQINDHSGPINLEASVKAAGDPFRDNDKYRESIVVSGRPKILYLEGHQESAHYLRAALDREGFEVQSVQPSEIPSSMEELDSYDAVILSDVPRESLTERQMRALASYVRDLGGGFILAGGENNYGRGGYSHTPVEDMLPVTFETKKEEPDMLAIVIVLDKSGSMGGQKIELAKAATKAPLSLLEDTDQFGVVAFDFNAYWIVRLQKAGNRGPIVQAISSIAPGGDTNMFPSLNEAYIALEKSPAQVKHVILLSDGYSVPNDYRSLIGRMAQARITVSTVAVGEGADRQLLADIASWGGGRSYYIRDVRGVPQIFTKETQLAEGRTLREEPFKPVVRKSVEALKGLDFAAAPPLLGYVVTRPKQTSEILLEHAVSGRLGTDPILVRWQYGLGKTAAFTSDLKDRWAAEWLKWEGYPKFWAQLVRATMRDPDHGLMDFSVRRSGDTAALTLDAMQSDGQFRNKFDVEVQVVAPDRSVSSVEMRQEAPGTYEATYPLLPGGSYIFRAAGKEAGGLSRALASSYPDEYRFHPPDEAVLRFISEETGGTFRPSAEDIFNPNGETTERPMPLWQYLAGAALVFYLIDVLLRRIRLS